MPIVAKPETHWLEWTNQRGPDLPDGEEYEVDPFYLLDDEEQDDYLFEVAKRANTAISEKAPKPTAEDEEAFLQTFNATLFALGGVPDEDNVMLYAPEPDGQHVEQLDAVADQLEGLTALPQMALRADLIDVIAEDIRNLGVVGERETALLLYLVGTSSKLARPLSAIVQGASSAGKSHVTGSVAKLFPPEQVLNATRISPKALENMIEADALVHRFVVAGERSHKADDEQADNTATLRQLQSEREITKLVSVKMDGKWGTEQRTIRGPIAYVETTTIDPKKIFPEDLNRALLLKPDESADQTAAVLERTADRYAAEPRQREHHAVLGRHHQFQRSLRPVRVVIPYGRKLMAGLPTHKIEVRRVAQQVLSLIEAIAFLHQHQRPTTDGAVVATSEDYLLARQLLLGPVGRSLGCSEAERRLYDALAAEFSGGRAFTVKMAHGTLGRAGGSLESVKKHWLPALVEIECVRLVEQGRGPRPSKYALTGKTPDDGVLPEVDAIAG